MGRRLKKRARFMASSSSRLKLGERESEAVAHGGGKRHKLVVVEGRFPCWWFREPERRRQRRGLPSMRRPAIPSTGAVGRMCIVLRLPRLSHANASSPCITCHRFTHPHPLSILLIPFATSYLRVRTHTSVYDIKREPRLTV